MSLTDFLHGVETVTVDTGARTVQSVRSSVIGLPYTAPDADPVKFPLNTVVLFNRLSDTAGLGKTGTGPDAFDGIFDQMNALVVGVRVEEGANELATLANFIGGVDATTGALLGVHALRAAESTLGVSPMLLCAPGFTHQRPVGVASTAMSNQGAGYTVATVAFSGGGALVQAQGTAVIEGGKVVGITITRPGMGYTAAPTITITGNGTGAAATATTGATANPLVAEMIGLANELRAHIIADGPSTTDAAAIAARGDWGTRRVYLVEPRVTAFSSAAGVNVNTPASARVAGHIARIDNEFGYWESPSNKDVTGILGIGRPIDSLGKNSRANILNENEVAVFIRDEGWKLWGNRTCSADPKYAFLSISRTCDIIDLSIAKGHRWAVDRGITRTYFEDVTASVNAFLRKLAKSGAIIKGECWVDPEFNTKDTVTAGQAIFSYKFSGIYPAERVTFRSQLTDEYIAEIFK
jgi:phage tail sheath protein FI